MQDQVSHFGAPCAEQAARADVPQADRQQPGKSILIDSALEDTARLLREHGARRVLEAIANLADAKQLTMPAGEARHALELEDLALRLYVVIEDHDAALPLLASAPLSD